MSISPVTQELSQIEGLVLDDEVSFADLTTLKVGGRPITAARCATPAAAAEAIRVLDHAGVTALVVGGGSNLVVADGDLEVVAVLLEFDDVTLDPTTGVLTMSAGVRFDDVVAAACEAGLGGIEVLSGIPGSAGATPVQNVGAYGGEIADVLSRVRLYDRRTGEDAWVPASDLELSYRYSNLKFTHRAVVLEVELQLNTDGLSHPLRYGELACRMGATGAGERFEAGAVREAVLDLRRGKGMVLDPSDPDTFSAGSFFTNPVVTQAQAEEVAATVLERLGADEAAAMPRYRAGSGQVKLSAAWLIERAGFPKGWPGPDAAASLSTKHTLALTNRGNAQAGDIIELARRIQAGVRDVFGVELVAEPVWVGASL